MSKNLKKLFSLVCLLSIAQIVSGQDTYNYSQFFINPSLLNPAYTGIDGQPAAFLAYRRQWMGITGSPAIGSFNLQAPLPSRIGLGIGFFNDQRGLINTSAVQFSSSYYVTVAPEAFLRFGFSGGAAWNKVDLDALNFGAIGDDVLTDLLSSNVSLMGSVGLAYQFRTFQIGASVPNIFQPNYLSKDALDITQVKPFQSVIIHSSYRLYFNRNKYAFEPSLIYRFNNAIPSQVEAAAVLHMNNMAWVGASYKHNFGISGMLGFKFSKHSGLGYSYTMKNTGINELNRPSHEVQLAFLFGARNKKIPMYSFVNVEKEKGRAAPTHEKQQYYAKNNPKNNPQPSNGKPSSSGSGRLRTNDPLATNSTASTTNKQPTKPTTSTEKNNSGTHTRLNANAPLDQDPGLTAPSPTNDQNKPIEPVVTDTKPTVNNKPVEKKPEPEAVKTPTNTPVNTEANKQPVVTQPTVTPQSNPVVNRPTNTQPTTAKPDNTNVTNNQPVNTVSQNTQPTTTNQPKPETTPTKNPDPDPVKPTDNQPVSKPTQTTAKPAASVKPGEKVILTEEEQSSHEEEVLARLDEHSDNPMEEHGGEEHAHSERHEFWQRGNHEKELEIGHYVIVGVFKSEANAKRVSDGYKNLGFEEVDYGFQSGKGFWFVHIAGSEDADVPEAQKLRNKYRKMKMFKDAWLLTVHQ